MTPFQKLRRQTCEHLPSKQQRAAFAIQLIPFIQAERKAEKALLKARKALVKTQNATKVAELRIVQEMVAAIAKGNIAKARTNYIATTDLTNHK